MVSETPLPRRFRCSRDTPAVVEKSPLYSKSPEALANPLRKLVAYSSDVNGVFQRDVNGRSGDVNKVRSGSYAGIAIMPEACPIKQGSGTIY
jgi:hypothetical protein